MDDRILTIEKWGRWWALFEGEDMLAVILYKKGALEVKRRIEELKATIQNNQTNKRKEMIGDE